MEQNRKVTTMRKKFALLLSLCFVIAAMLMGCGTDPRDVDYNGVSYDELEMTSEQSITAVTSMSPEEMQYYIESESYAPAVLDLFRSWQEAIAISGEYQSLGEFTVEKSGKTLTTTHTLVCENRNVQFQVVYSYYNMQITGYTVEPVYSLGEKMSKAGLNTVISMAIVFGVLILISLIINCFNIFPYLENKKKEKEKAALTGSNDQVVSQIIQREEQLTDDTELVAVIAAAIAASTGQSTSDFVVRSIHRR